MLSQLLVDHTTGHNILWCTHDYELKGDGYQYSDEIKPKLITGKNGSIIKPRVLKTKEEQTDRVKDMAEVFTPLWVVKMMVENVEIEIDTKCLELTYGEAPFLVSRYDATSGEPIAIGERVGILDQKLRLINDRQLGFDSSFQPEQSNFRQVDTVPYAKEGKMEELIEKEFT